MTTGDSGRAIRIRKRGLCTHQYCRDEVHLGLQPSQPWRPRSMPSPQAASWRKLWELWELCLVNPMTINPKLTFSTSNSSRIVAQILKRHHQSVDLTHALGPRPAPTDPGVKGSRPMPPTELTATACGHVTGHAATLSRGLYLTNTGEPASVQRPAELSLMPVDATTNLSAAVLDGAFRAAFPYAAMGTAGWEARSEDSFPPLRV